MLVVGCVVWVGVPAAATELKDGEVIGKDNAASVRELLPVEIYQHYVKGEYQNSYFDLSKPNLHSPLHPPVFRAATEANRGRYALTPENSIVYTDGKDPGFITGFPFPDIDINDPQAGPKVVWNYFYNWWFNGNGHFYNELVWVNRSGIDRAVVAEALFMYYQSAPEAKDLPNPLKLYQRSKTLVRSPADLHGTAALSWRFKDPQARDQNWTYVPALRRVRAVSPANRSDGFLGSDLAQDDGQYFDGKPEDFEWKLVGETEQLVLADAASYRGDVELRAVPGGGWRTIWDERPWVGYETPGWTGLKWAPTEAVLVKRPFWVIEGVPKDRYYLFGKLVLRFDRDTYRGYWASKYDWKGALLASYQVQNGAFHTPDGGEHWFTAARSVYQTAENVKLDRATTVRFTRSPETPADYKVPLRPEEFAPDWLVRSGK